MLILKDKRLLILCIFGAMTTLTILPAILSTTIMKIFIISLILFCLQALYITFSFVRESKVNLPKEFEKQATEQWNDKQYVRSGVTAVALPMSVVGLIFALITMGIMVWELF
jgi:Ca2+/Na+ antiporter